MQFNYSISDRHAEKRLLDAAAAGGLATLINRPLGTGADMQRVQDHPLPAWIVEAGVETWSQYLLAYIISHPAVTCVIPATANPAHAAENMHAATIQLDERMRKKMRDHARDL